MANTSGFDPAAWSIDGARHAGDLLRVLAYAATNGAEGVVAPGDCKVHQLGTPGPQIAIDAGGLVVRNSSGNTRNQTYVSNARSQSTLDVAPTGSSAGRSDAVIVRMRDPQYSPWPSTVPADYQYVDPIIVQNVSPSATKASDLNLGYSAYMLARLDLPKNTTNIGDAMVKNTRELAQPRSWHRFYGGPPGLSEAVVYPPGTADDSSGAVALPGVRPDVEIPSWATHYDLVATSALQTVAGSKGATYVRLGDMNGPLINWDGELRQFTATDIAHPIPLNRRGTTQQAQHRFRIDVGQVAVIGWSSIVFNVAFYERVV